MTANCYAFACPVTRGVAEIGHCEAVHAASTKGDPRQIENKTCAVAHIAWICPYRNAVKYMGEWSTPATYPRWESPREKPGPLPPLALKAATSRLMPRPDDYRRCGLRPGELDAVFKDLNPRLSVVQVAGADDAPQRKTKRAPAGDPGPITHGPLDTQKALAGAIERALTEGSDGARENAPQSPESAPGHSDTPKKKAAPQRGSQSPAAGSAKPTLTLAERAARMKERNAK